MPGITAAQRPTFAVGEVLQAKVSFAPYLDAGELLTGTPTVAEQTTSNLVLGAASVSTGALTIRGVTVATGAAVQFQINAAAAVAGRVYEIKVTATTNSTPAQTRIARIEFECVA